MSNLIPPAGKSVVTKEYFVRVFSMFAMLTSLVFIALTIFLLPRYVLISAQTSGTIAKETDSDLSNSYKEAEKEMRAVNDLITQLAQPTHTVLASKILDEIVGVPHEGVVLKSFQLSSQGGMAETKKEGEDTITVQGVADSRAQLITFRNELENSPLFERAVVPISDLARNVDVGFVMTLTLAKIPKE